MVRIHPPQPVGHAPLVAILSHIPVWGSCTNVLPGDDSLCSLSPVLSMPRTALVTVDNSRLERNSYGMLVDSGTFARAGTYGFKGFTLPADAIGLNCAQE